MEEVFAEVLNRSVQAGIVVCFVLLARWVFSLCRVPKKYAYFLWLIPFVRFALPVTLQSFFSLLPKQAENFHEVTVEWLEQTAQNPQAFIQIPVMNQADISSLAPTPYDSADPLQIFTGICSYLWIAVAAMLVVFSLCRLFVLGRKLRMSIHLRDNIYLTDEVDTPFVIGILRPRIYLPSDLEEQELSYVILHEQTHIRRQDMLLKVAAFLITLVHWFNPLAWAALLCLGNDMEMSCDEAVMRKLGKEKGAEYAQTLLRLSVGRQRLCRIGLAFGEGNTKGRVKNIMKYKKPLLITSVFALFVTGTLLVGLLTNPIGEEGKEQESTQPISETQGQEETIKNTEAETEEKETLAQKEVLSYMAEGMPVEHPANRYAKDGYQILIPTEFEQKAPGSFVAAVNDKVGIRIETYADGETLSEKDLLAEGFLPAEEAFAPHMVRTASGLREHVLLPSNGKSTFRITYFYPDGAEYEEGFAILLRASAMSFTMEADSSGSSNTVEITVPQLSPDMTLGADGTQLDYAGGDIIIFHDYYGLFVFSLYTGGITELDGTKKPYGLVGAVDLAAIGCQYTQGDNACEVNVSKDGRYVYLHPSSEKQMYVYDVYAQRMIKQSYSLEGIELFDSFAEPEELYKRGACSAKGVRFPGGEGYPDYYGYLVSHDGTVGDLSYVESDMVFMLFTVAMPEGEPNTLLIK